VECIPQQGQNPRQVKPWNAPPRLPAASVETGNIFEPYTYNIIALI